MQKSTRIFLALMAFAALFFLNSCSSIGSCGIAPEPSVPSVYTVHRIVPENAPGPETDWESPKWETAEVFFLSNVLPQSKYKGARIYGKILHDGKRIYVLFRAANDRFVQAAAIHPQSYTCLDTCVEFFMAPEQEKGGYFNIEASLDGVALIHYHKNQKTPFEDYGPISEEDYKKVRICASQNRVVLPEITKETEWWVSFSFDAELPIRYTDAKVPAELSGQTWNANFYHCSEFSSHPRWFTWMPITALNFHLPECFGKIHFE